jgi:nucleotide-binding universal stress UspA family protein
VSEAPLYESIVVGYDGTEPAQHALTRAATLSKLSGAKLVVVDVAGAVPIEGSDGAFGLTPYSYPYSSVETARTADDALWQAHRSRVEEYLAERGVEAEFAGVVGQPAGELIDVAEQRSAGLIVVGTRDPGMLERMFGGSVSQGVAKHAHCDVLIVRAPESSESDSDGES